MNRSSVGSILVALLSPLALLGSCSRGDGRAGETFTNGGLTLKAAVTSDATNKIVTVTDASDTTVLTLDISRTNATLSAAGKTDTRLTFHAAQEELPTDYTASRMAVYVAGIRALKSNTSQMPDSPGCDWFPDTQCTLDCCAQHDRCYRENGCGASSWIWGFGSSACNHCNALAYDCIAAACVGVTDSFLPNNCYDARCNMFYDCPPAYNSCTCRDICADSNVIVSSSCGDGQCAPDENQTNCWNDCAFGVPAVSPASVCGDGVLESSEACENDDDCGDNAGCFDCHCVNGVNCPLSFGPMSFIDMNAAQHPESCSSTSVYTIPLNEGEQGPPRSFSDTGFVSHNCQYAIKTQRSPCSDVALKINFTLVWQPLALVPFTPHPACSQPGLVEQKGTPGDVTGYWGRVYSGTHAAWAVYSTDTFPRFADDQWIGLVDQALAFARLLLAQAEQRAPACPTL